MATALTDLDTLKAFLGIALSNTAFDEQLNVIIPGVSQTIANFIGWDPGQQSRTDYFDGSGARDLVLRAWPVISTGLQVWMDSAGYYGDGLGASGTGAFPSSTLQVLGQDYALIRDDQAAGRRGVLRRLGVGSGGSGAGSAGYWPPYGGGGAMNATLTGGWGGPRWPAGSGNVKVTYTAGFATIPADLTLAANMVASYLKRVGPLGGATVTGETLGEYSMQVGLLQNRATSALAAVGELGDARQILAKYKDLLLF